MGSEFRGFRAQGLAGLGVRVEGFRFWATGCHVKREGL